MRQDWPGVKEPTPPTGRVLVIDDEWAIRDILQTILSAEGYDVDGAENGARGLEQIKAQHYDVLVTDLLMPGIGGEEVVSQCRTLSPDTICIITSGLGMDEAMRTAARIGAFETLAKPFNFDRVKAVLARAMEFQKLRHENAQLKSRLEIRLRRPPIIGNSEAVAILRHVLRSVGESDSTVLVRGEQGTGRELAAREIHLCSARAARPWIVVNCDSVPESVLEIELFGTEPGAMAQSPSGRKGWIELADDGTILLKEVGALSRRIQQRLAKAIESRTFSRMGEGQALPLRARIIATTGLDLEAAARNGAFDPGLLHCLTMVPVQVPSLRERREDIPLLMAHFAEERSRRDGRPPVRFSAEAISCLMNHDWPGNLRELMSFIDSMAMLRSGAEVDLHDLPETYRTAGARTAIHSIFEKAEGAVDFNLLIAEYERALIEVAMRKAGGVKNQAASLLNLKRTTLVEKMKKMRISSQPYADVPQSHS